MTQLTHEEAYARTRTLSQMAKVLIGSFYFLGTYQQHLPKAKGQSRGSRQIELESIQELVDAELAVFEDDILILTIPLDFLGKPEKLLTRWFRRLFG